MRLIQLLGDDVIGIYKVEDGINDDYIENLYNEYEESECADFDEYLESNGIEGITRTFVDEIYV